ncbi:MAG: c-type cytochrome [Bacteroidetes bacterium]|nr:c-type cytochrome [Bacteroidota bacterium]
MKINLNNLKKVKIESVFLLSVVFLVFSLIYFLVFIFDFQTDWANYQESYKDISSRMAKTDQEKELINQFEVNIKQIHIKELNKTDRCISCHVSIDEEKFKNIKQPLTSHPGEYLKNHPIEKFGCTICHGGLGMATTTESAHGAAEEEGSLYPMLGGVFIQSSCGKCHAENSYKETSVIGKGKRLFDLYGCNVCHKLYKSGGTAGPDLTKIGAKKYYDVSWGSEYHGDKNISEWLVNHFENPSYYYESKMMDFKMNNENATALAVYMLSLVPEEIPTEYVVKKKENISEVIK